MAALILYTCPDCGMTRVRSHCWACVWFLTRKASQ